MPAQFWSLTVREFWIKHAAFSRSEDRLESLMLRQAARTTSYKKSDKAQIDKAANVLRRYPVKPWLRKD